MGRRRPVVLGRGLGRLARLATAHPTTMRTLNTIVRFVITMTKLAPICWAGAKQAASEGRS